MVQLKDNGRKANGLMPDAITPLTLSIRNGTVTLPDFPAAVHLGLLSSPNARRAADLSLLLHSLDEAQAALTLIRTTLMSCNSNEGHPPLVRALWTGLAVSYARCFGGKYGLDPALVFAGIPDGLEAHEYLFALRSKHYAHDVNDRRQAYWAVVIGEGGTVLGIAKQQHLALAEGADLANAGKLIRRVQDYIGSELASLEIAIDHELDQLSPDARLSLPEPQYKSPTAGSVKSERRRGSGRK